MDQGRRIEFTRKWQFSGGNTLAVQKVQTWGTIIPRRKQWDHSIIQFNSLFSLLQENNYAMM